MKIIQPNHPLPWTTDSTIIGIIRATKNYIYNDFIDGKRKINARYRIMYLYAEKEDGLIWAGAKFVATSDDPEIIDKIEKNHICKNGDLVICQNHVVFPNDQRMYTRMYTLDDLYILEQEIKYSIEKTTFDELFTMRYYRELLGKYKSNYLNGINILSNNA